MYSGSEFQIEEAAAGKARLPTVESLTDGTMQRLVAAERRVRRPGTSATRVRGPRYRRATVKNSVTQHGDLVLYALQYPQPMKANERISDVIGALQVEDQPCHRVQHRLESAQEVGWDTDQHAVAVVQPGVHTSIYMMVVLVRYLIKSACVPLG